MTDSAVPHGTGVALPRRRQLAVTWGIPDDYGGMTAAMLHRSRLFVRDGGAQVDVVTFAPVPDVAATRARLIARGELVGGMAMRNIYEDFRLARRRAVEVPVTPGAAARPPDDVAVAAQGAVAQWVEDGIVVRTEHRRPDGSVAVLEERADTGRRLVTAFDVDGAPTGQWRSASAFRFAWLDDLLAGEDAVVVVDSKTAARFMQHYRRPFATMIHVVHGAHHDRDGALTASRRELFAHLDRWDAVVFLTERQRAAAVASLGDPGNLVVAGNALTLPARPSRLPADRLHGVIVSRLTSIKRVDHALRILRGVRELGIPATAEIIGDGPERAHLAAAATQLELTDAVRFTGYRPGAAERFGRGAWTLLTSSSEGESLTLAEAMAAGCLPVAYDIRYGPAEIIRDGRTGFLVADGDVDAAVAALARLCSLADDDLAGMRRAARHAAEGHSEDLLVPRWREIQDAAVRRRAERYAQTRGSTVRRSAIRIIGRVGGPRAVELSRAAVRALRGSRRRRR